MAKISFKKKAGGTKVGNLIRSGVKAAKGVIKSGNLQANAGAAVAKIKNPLQTSTQKAQPIFKATVGQGLSATQTAQANKALGFAPKTGLVNSKGQPVAVPNIGSAPLNLGRATSSGGLTSSGSTASRSSTPITTTSSLSSSSGSTSPTTTSLSQGIKSTPTSNIINTPTLGAQNTKLTLPEKVIADASMAIPTIQEQVVQQAQDKTQSSLEDYLASITEAPSSADAYQKAQRETQILQKQQEVNDLQGKLNSIVSRGEAQQLAQVGQGRGIPEAIIGGIQAQIGRETAIASLPIAAQLSAAQGNLEMANDNLNTLFKIYSEDATNEYNYRKEVKKAVYDFASDKEKRELAKLDKLEERSYQATQKDLADRKSIALEAVKNGAPASILTAIGNSTDFNSAIQAAGQYLGNTSVIKLDNGNTVIVDSRGKVIKNLGGAAPGSVSGNSYAVTSDILKNNFGNDIVGLIASTIKNSGAKQNQTTNDAINVISGLQQLVSDAPSGVFKGLAPIRLLPGKAKSQEALTNLSNIEALNLKVQQWASGASLTAEQTKSVEKITPRKGDTDQQVIAKTNALANYMISQVSGQLAGQGVGFSVDKVNLFTKTPTQELQEIYNDPVMKQKIIQASQMFPSYSDAEILQIVRP